MFKSKQKIILYSLILFSTYSAITLGQTWDEGHLTKQGQITINYLLSLGRLDESIFRREYYSPIYYSLKYLFLQTFPMKYQVEANHLVNLIFSFGVIFGIKQLCKELFNNKVANITFLVLFFFPAFHGHMSFNSKDTIIAFCHVWIFYSFIKYLKNQSTDQSSKYFYNIGILSAVGTGINLFFLGSLIPVFLFTIYEVFFSKKICNKNFKKKIFFIDTLKSFLIFYILLVIFWIDTHPNILILPFKFFLEWTFTDLWRGYPFILINGDYFIYKDIPKSYLITNFIYKSPEFFLVSYFIFFIALFRSNGFFSKKFLIFNYKIILVLLMIIYPFVLLYFTPFSIYDGFRHVLWMIPYTCIIPALAIYFIIENIKLIYFKIVGAIQLILLLYFFSNFILLTPYHYTYLNILNGKAENLYQKFENDYWGSSIRELIYKTKLNKNSRIIFSSCGIAEDNAKYYLKKAGFSNFSFESLDKSEFIIMTNRTTSIKENIYSSNNITNCFDKFNGTDISQVKRNGVVLSVIRKIN